ncbi:MAG: hypothetical protein JW825_03035 [Candidatus Methanofastidiosa archaeon]|nr:hypothetical protein [Candidatus Methanofastidiosa archaeon]
MSEIIQNLSIRSIDAKRFVRAKEKMRNLKITNSSSITSLHMEEDALVIEFILSVDYFPNVASIKIEGEMRYVGDISGVDVNDKSTLRQDISREAHTAILRFCLPELVIISKQLELLPPIPFPSMERKNPGEAEKVRDNLYDYR